MDNQLIQLSHSVSLCRPILLILLLLSIVLPASALPSNSSSPAEECSFHFPPTVLSNASLLDCPSLNALLFFMDDLRHRNVSSLRLNCEGKEQSQQRVFDRLTFGQQFRSLKNLSLLNCGPSSARFSQLPHLEELDLVLTNLARLDWLSIGSTHLHLLKIGRLSAMDWCEKCQNKWLMEQQKVVWPNPIFPQLPEHIVFTSPLPPNCSFGHCPNESVQFGQNIVLSRLGSPLRLRCHFETQKAFTKPLSSSNDQKTFVWLLSNLESERQWEERPTSEGDVELVVDSLNRHHLGLVACRCWHCNSPRFDVAELRFWTPLSVSVNVPFYDQKTVYQSSHTLLLVHGYPLKKLRLGVRQLPNNLTEWHHFPAEESDLHIFFNGSLLIRSELAHSHFFLRYFSITIHECSDCGHSQMGGAFEFDVCREAQREGRESKKQKDLLGITRDECADTVGVQIQPINHPKANGTGMTNRSNSSNIKLSVYFLTSFVILLILSIGLLTRTMIKEKRVKRRRGWRMSGHSQLTTETNIPLYTLSHCPSLPQQRHNLRVIDSKNLQLNERIGKGAFGAVYEAIWRESEKKAEEELGTNEKEEVAEHSKENEQHNARKVAMKFLTNVNFDAMEKEAALLARLDHPNVLRMFGISFWKGQIALVLELMNCGDLRSYIQERAPSHGQYAKFPPALNYFELVDISIQIGEGLCYLFQRQVVHRDLAARNCLVSGDSDNRCKNANLRPPICVKICDFGMSRCLYSSMEYYKMSSKSAVPIRWTAPECLNNGKYTLQTDIWSFGVLLFELFSYGETPFGAFISNEKVSNALKNGAVPNVPEKCSTEMAELMRKCWERIAEERISAEEALRTLKDIRRRQKEEHLNYDKHAKLFVWHWLNSPMF